MVHNHKSTAASRGSGKEPERPAREVVVVIAPDATRSTDQSVLPLTEMGYEVVTVPSLSEPGLLSKLGPRVIFVECTGKSVASLREIKRQCGYARVPIIGLVDAAERSMLADLARAEVDDFIVKPASAEELKARVLLRVLPSGQERPALGVWPLVERRAGDRRKLPQRAAGLVFLTGLELDSFLTIDIGARQVLLHGRPLAITPKEFDLLALLASAPGRVFTDAEIVERIWSGKQNASSADVAQYVHRLRKKLGDDPRRPQWLLNVKRFGYKLNSTFSAGAAPGSSDAAPAEDRPQPSKSNRGDPT